MGARLSSLVVDLQVESAQLRKGLDEATAKIDAFASNLESGVKSKMVSAIQEAVVSLDLLKEGAHIAFDALKDGFKGMMEDEQGVNRLSGALQHLGYNAGALVPMFEAQTEALEKSTLVDGNTIRQVQQLMAQFNVAPSAIGPATEAVLNYSAATGQDAVSSTRQLLTAVTKGKDEIAKMGISFEATGDKSKDLAAATAALEQKFGGSASAATKGLSGDVGLLKKATEDLEKAFAKFVTSSGVGQKVLIALTQAMDGAAYALSDEAAEDDAKAKRAYELASATDALTKSREALKSLEQNLADVQQKNDPVGTAIIQKRIDEERKLIATLEDKVRAMKKVIATSSQAAVQEVAATNAAIAEADRKAREAAERERAHAERQAEAKAVGKAVSEAGRVGIHETTATQLEQARQFRPLQAPAPGRGDFFQNTLLQGTSSNGVKKLDQELEAFGEQVGRSLEDAARSLAGKLAGSVNGLGDVLKAMQEGMASGGPIAAVIAGFAELASKSEQFAHLQAILNKAFQAMADVVGVVIEPFIPLAEVVAQFWEALKPVAQALMALSPLTLVLKAVAEALRWLYIGVLTVANFLTGHGANSLTDAMASMRDTTKATAAAVKGLADGARKATDEILNAPSGFKVAAYRYGAQSTSGEPAPGGGSSGGGLVPEGDPIGRIGGGGPIGKGPPGGPIGRGPRGGGPLGKTGELVVPVTVQLQVDRNLNLSVVGEDAQYRRTGSRFALSSAAGT